MRNVSWVFLDRDGVIIEDRADFVKSLDEIIYIPAALQAVRRLTAAGLPIVIVTNQSAVGRKIITSDFVDETNAAIVDRMREAGGAIAGVFYCPHHPDAGCDCRKPRPGLLFGAASELGLNLAEAVMVGDSLRDLQAARAAGMRAILVRTGKGAVEEALLADESPDLCVAVVDDLDCAADLILEPVAV